jgi:glutamate racemase
MNTQPIGVFDSGVGGLSILLEIQKLLPNETSIFVADQAYVPYGRKSKEELIERVGKIMDFFVKNEVKAVVVACNTATVYTIDEMRKKYNIPIIGTVPVIKVIARMTRTGKTAVFSTPATAKSPYLAKLIEEFAPNIVVEKVGGSNLEELIENGNINDPAILERLKFHLLPLVKDGVDAIALGCTHYPFLKEKIKRVVGSKVKIVDSGGAVARRLAFVLEHEKILSQQKGQDLYYTTGDKDKFEKVASELTKKEITAEHVNL